MNFRDLFYMIGFKPRTRTYGYSQNSYVLPGYGKLETADWLHPKAGKTVVDVQMINALKTFLRQGDVALDIGAYTGDTAIPMALAVGRQGWVFAVEPNPYVLPVLEKNASLNKQLTNIIPLNFAATPDDCEMQFEYSDPGFCNGGFHENISQWKHGHLFKLKVKGKNLYTYLKENYPSLIDRIRYIKIDAEGFDCTVLETLEDLVNRVKPYLRVEVFKKSELPYRLRLYKFLKRHGYTVYHTPDAYHYKGEMISEDNLMKWQHYDVFAEPN